MNTKKDILLPISKTKTYQKSFYLCQLKKSLGSNFHGENHSQSEVHQSFDILNSLRSVLHLNIDLKKKETCIFFMKSLLCLVF